MNNKKHISTKYPYKRSECIIYFKFTYKTALYGNKKHAPTHKWLKSWLLFPRAVFSSMYSMKEKLKYFLNFRRTIQYEDFYRAADIQSV